MFADPRQEKFVNRAEERILKENTFPPGIRTYHIEGHVILGQLDEYSVFFNSKFESGNLRQVFKVLEKTFITPEQIKASRNEALEAAAAAALLAANAATEAGEKVELPQLSNGPKKKLEVPVEVQPGAKKRPSDLAASDSKN